jgi:hypothetical protein
MILRNGKFSGKILRKIFRMEKFSMENFLPHITINHVLDHGSVVISVNWRYTDAKRKSCVTLASGITHIIFPPC